MRRILRVVAAIRPHDQAAVVRRNPQAGQRARDPGGDCLVAHILDHDVQQVADAHLARLVVQPARRQRPVDLLLELWLLAHMVVRLAQVEVAGATRRDQLMGRLGGGQGQVTGDQAVGRQPVQAKVLGRAAAVPVIDFDKMQPQLLGHALGRTLVGVGRSLQRAAGIIGVVSVWRRHLTPPAAQRCAWLRRGSP